MTGTSPRSTPEATGPGPLAELRAKSWLDLPGDHPFGLATLPYGVYSTNADPTPRVGVRVGDSVLDLEAAMSQLAPRYRTSVQGTSLDALLAAGPQTWSTVRALITSWLTEQTHQDTIQSHLVPADQANMHLPFAVADYVDFYASEHHATNLGRMFRPDQEPLTPNWKHLPIGYHGRSGTIVASGTEVVRPCGQRRTPQGEIVFGSSQRLDIEAEVGFVVGTPSAMGNPVPLDDFEAHVFGVCLVNDWSARDLQSWEYVPLGPFLGKSFATSISPWVVPLAALDTARLSPPPRSVPLLGYLDDTSTDAWGLDIDLEVRLNGHLVSRPPFAGMYWTGAQMLAHMTVNGASLRTGDFFASGTISGERPEQRGSFIELSWGGTQPFELADGSTRTFLEDDDEVVITATAPGPGGTVIGLGEVRGRIVPAPGEVG